MDLEQRMAKMEEEIHILKNQIQSTLLDIEEQIMNHYYPSLRSGDEEEAPSASPRGQGRSRVSERPAPEPEAPTADEGAHIAIKRVTLGDVRQGKPQRVDDGEHRMKAPNADVVNTAALLAWAKQTMDTIGSRATGEAIESFSAEGYLDAETAELLLQVVAMTPERQDGEPANMASVVSALGALGRIVGSYA